MYVWMLLTLLIGVQASAVDQRDLQEKNIIPDFLANETERNATDKTVDSILTTSLPLSISTSMHTLKLKNRYGSKNEFRWNVSAIGSSMLNDIDKTVDNLLRKFLTPSSSASISNFKLKNGYGSNNQFHWNVTAIGSSILNDIEELSKPFQFAKPDEQLTEKMAPSTTPMTAIVNSRRVYDTNRKNRWNRLNFVDSIYHELYRFPQKLIPLASQALSQIRDYSERSEYIKKGYVVRESETTSRSSMHRKPPSGLMTPTFIKNWKHYIVGARQCMSSAKSYFNLPKAVIEVMKHSPRTAATIVRNRLKKAVPRHPASKKTIYSGYEAMTCQVLANGMSSYYECLKEMRRVSAYVGEKTKKSAESKALREYHRRIFWPSALRLIESVGDLNNSCKVDNKASTITCSVFNGLDNNPNVGMNMSNRLGWSPTGTEAQKIAQQMIEVLLKNQLGADVLEEIGTCVYIYQRASSAQHKLRKISRNDPQARGMYVTITNNLEAYKHNLMRIALGAVNDVRSMFTAVEGTLVKSMSQFLGIDFSEHVKSKRCWDEFLDTILGSLLGDNDWENDGISKPKPPKPDESRPGQPIVEQENPEKPKPEQPGSEQSNPNGSGSVPSPEQPVPANSAVNPSSQVEEPSEKPASEVMRSYENKSHRSSESSSQFDDSDDSADSSEETNQQSRKNHFSTGVIPRKEAAQKLMNSLQRLSQTKVLRKQNTIASLANTFLLATMFYECITVIAAAVYRTERATDSESPITSSTPIYQEMTSVRDQEQSWET
ncbi:uncharacterized protein LOC135169744 [Diachasmimorpha longicaudata]|uniref:uncharacterized protein LOC135169744 n=1 Tax=Diachasmimorpha longicaudata TaxID=58733 RepID=UPI0030B883AB